ncbi:LD-carboxypeptidase [Reinekea marina]|uniref:S66 peptidase family protein n=1 Tax=Reinekea marina TaxID=1310421 RepID=A0ABV7WX86_9GAMM|nr:S66 peptidase family protein [Reinekea marina]MDN3650152.1 LD-carboxypeptidase [Reinekea marina]
MIYPAPLKQGSTIAVTAFSSGVTESQKPRLEAVVDGLRVQGFNVVFGQCLFGNEKHVSAPKEERADELMQFLLDDNIDAVAPPWGGELAIELLPLINFERLKKAKPKWILGFSDVCTISVALYSKLGWASAHCSNLMDLISTCEDALTKQALNYLSLPAGSNFTQNNSEKHTRKWPDIEKNPSAFIVGDETTQWMWLVPPENGEFMSGRLVGGCWDILTHLIETTFLPLSVFKERHLEGVLLYLENVEMSPCDLIRAIHSMMFRGVFSSINGLVLGRNFRVDKPEDELSYLDVLQAHLANKGIPVLYDVDIGHVPP